MPLKSLVSLFRSERRSHVFLVNEAWQQNRRFCVRCRTAKIYRLADKRYRCASCGYTFHDFTRRWVGELNLTARQWLWIVKLFELEVPPSQIAKEVGISYPTALKAIYLIRKAIAYQNEDDQWTAANANAAPALAPGGERLEYAARRAFGLVENQGRIAVDLVDDVSAESILQEQSKLTKQGSIILTGPYRQYDGLILWRYRLPRTAKRLRRSKPQLERLDNFWSFARPRLGRFHRSSDQDLYFFLKELAFRYEHRGEELFPALVSLMTQLMPKN
jgi:transposase